MLVKLLCQLGILDRQTAFGMRRERDSHLIPANINVRMVPRLLGKFRHSADELDGGSEILELKHTLNRRAFDNLPCWHSGERGFDFTTV